MNAKRTEPSLDYILILVIACLGIISFFTLYTLDPILPPHLDAMNFHFKQLVWYVIGSMVVVGVLLVDYDRLHSIVWIFYGFGVLMLVMLAMHFPPGIAKEINGAWGWFQIPGIGTLQPAEFMKVFLILALAHIIVRHQEKWKLQTIKTDLWLLAKIFVTAIVPMMLIAIQPDLGSFLVLSAITGAMILVAGVQWRILFTIFLSFLLVVGVLVFLFYINATAITSFLEESIFKHVDSRFYGWLQPEKYDQGAGMQLLNAMKSIGSGQLYGKGIGNMEVYIPERQTDMIFTAVAEQFGFFGSSIVVTLFFLMTYRMVHIAMDSNDPFGTYIIVGVIGMITFQVFQNIGMSIQLLPITGLPLPFISYGGSSTLAYMIALGIVLNIKSRTKTYMFE
ncbi:FtsW/RodA/SpoVE family cell cycle protein [Thalassobacillus hwangdonensis]|uniref:FtsW/RodA/SpoVE family cell cycle protein n=1 Tax=Thalassobacillus hwangdonensis TaxID=546108 RepID=A0ABW3KYL6_9BACI